MHMPNYVPVAVCIKFYKGGYAVLCSPKKPNKIRLKREDQRQKKFTEDALSLFFDLFLFEKKRPNYYSKNAELLIIR